MNRQNIFSRKLRHQAEKHTEHKHLLKPLHLNTKTPLRVYLIGMMGSGKSHWAKIIAQTTEMQWLDLDVAIEQAAQCTIAAMFELKGEAYFRKQEQICLHQTANKNNLIVATGGGAPCFFNNIQWMNSHGITIWLNEPAAVLTERAMKDVAHRPAIKGKTYEEVFELFAARLQERESFYQQATYTLSGSNITIENLLHIIKHA